MKIDFVSDIVCPWCAIGLASLSIALERLGPGVPIELRLRPFELNPQMGPEGEDIGEHLARKYGLDAGQLERSRDAIRERGASVGFRFGPRERIWNTFDAHRLLHWAGLQGRALPLKRRLLQAYHGEGLNVSDPACLLQCAQAAGLDVDAARQVLEQGLHAEEVRRDEQEVQALGISSVPAVILESRYLVSGGQPPEVFEQALRRVLDGNAERAAPVA